MPEFRLQNQKPYVINSPDRIPTPRLLVFKDRVERNIEKMKTYLEAIAPGPGLRYLCPHLKTNKSSHLTKMMLQAGVESVKVTMNELDMAIRAGCRQIFVAYPLLLHQARKLARIMQQEPEIEFQVQIGSSAHAEILATASKTTIWKYLLDLDVGMHRTGAAPERALEVYREVSRLDNFEFIGIHGYNGHIHQENEDIRREETQRSMEKLLAVVGEFEHREVAVKRVVVAGSQTYRFDLQILREGLSPEIDIQVSPGTWIYWDSGYDRLAPGEFEIAALILAQVIDLGPGSLVTLNLGHKRWAADQGKVEQFSIPEAQVISFNEEHTVIDCSSQREVKIGDYILIAPKHVCPTVNLFESFTLVDAAGDIEELALPVDGRNR